ncbi:MAG: carbohydrate kinase [Flavobacteriaceae bacterium]|nr:MAG: carbohydrate kinase [Flavobacteriaceae bacterium]
MKKESYILSVDQGTSGTKAIIFDKDGQLITKASVPLKSYYPKPKFVEQNPEEIFQNVLDAVAQCLKEFEQQQPGKKDKIISCGISNQRETFVLWDENGKPLYNAVVWQCKRSISICNNLLEEGMEKEVSTRTGLKIDPYFSATKLIWLYNNDEVVRQAINDGQCYFGTIDTWLLYKLTGGAVHATDLTNASRTLLFNISDLQWDSVLLRRFGLEKLRMPQLKHSSAHFGESNFNGLFANEVPITGVIGDSHAAAFGEGCFSSGTAKATMGTGSSILWNTGDKIVRSDKGMVTTICWSIEGRVDYALEGVIVSCGLTIEWLKNQLGFFKNSEETDVMAYTLDSNEGVYLIPAFSGLGAPHWQMDWKASIHGITFKSDKNHFVRAALESIPYQIKDVVLAMEQESNIHLKELKVDGGITDNTFLMQFMADLLDTNVVNIGIADVSALGAALIAGLGAGLWKNIEDLPKFKENLRVNKPASNTDLVKESYDGWQKVLTERKLGSSKG